MRHHSPDTCTVSRGLLSHIGMLRSLGRAEPQIEKTASRTETWTERLRQRQTEGYGGVKAGSWFHRGSCFSFLFFFLIACG